MRHIKQSIQIKMIMNVVNKVKNTKIFECKCKSQVSLMMSSIFKVYRLLSSKMRTQSEENPKIKYSYLPLGRWVPKGSSGRTMATWAVY